MFVYIFLLIHELCTYLLKSKHFISQTKLYTVEITTVFFVTISIITCPYSTPTTLDEITVSFPSRNTNSCPHWDKASLKEYTHPTVVVLGGRVTPARMSGRETCCKEIGLRLNLQV